MNQKKARWRRLDNAAKLYSAASNKRDTRVFRFYCELKEEVRKELLQEALDQTVETFPMFLMVLRKGLFWHYLEPCNLHPVVKEEYKEPCSRLYVKDKKTLLFEVTYYKKRINFEVFHVLTDGTGATEFLKELVSNYLYLAHHEDGLEDVAGFHVAGRYDCPGPGIRQFSEVLFQRSETAEGKENTCLPDPKKKEGWEPSPCS